MAYCSKCGAKVGEKATFCSGCGNALIASTPAGPSRPSPSAQNTSGGIAQSASNSILQKLGLEMIQGFSMADFFSEVFRRHDPREIERRLAVGSPETTPPLNAEMGILPNPWIFFRVLCGTLLVYFTFVVMWNTYHNLNVVPGLIVIGSFAVPFSILILFFELNTPKNISIVMIIKLLMIGGGFSLLVTLILYSNAAFLISTFGASAAGFVEEIGKLAALLFVLRKVKDNRYKYRLNALLLGAAVGTGFAAFESAGYAFRIGLQMGPGAMLDNILLRGILAPFCHVAWTAIAASAFWIARPYHNTTFETVMSPRFLKLFAVPVALHFIWNYGGALPFHMNGLARVAVLGFVSWVVLLSLVQSGLREMAELTAPEDTAGVVAENPDASQNSAG
jgi:RsiW-degrading membrane proteinase PrsW (M82 family)